MRHIIICGYSRSGTTMFYNMLRSSVTGLCFFDREIEAAKVIGLDSGDSISKSPRDIFRLDAVANANSLSKDVLLLIVIRDIRSILTSYHVAVPDDYFMAYDHCYAPDQAGNAPYTGPGVIPTARAIAKATRDKRFRSVVVRYEDLLSDPGAQEERLGRLAGLSFGGRFADFHQHDVPERLTRQLNGIRPIDKSRVDAWKDPQHVQRIRSQFTRCPALFDLLIAYGYEKDRGWFDDYRRPSPPTPAS